jgi:SAM-dependent methyltransferase
MTTLPGSADDPERRIREREDADRTYNDALTALDNAIQRLRELPDPPPPYDELQITPLNQRWELLPLKPDEGSGWLRRIRRHAWSMVAPLFERQQAFNSAVVDHVNRNAAVHREMASALAAMLAIWREESSRLVDFQTKLILYAQQITPYVDTKDREVAGLVRALAAGLSQLTDEVQKRSESMAAWQRRREDEIEEVRNTVAVGQRAVHALKRELDRRAVAQETTYDTQSAPTAAPSGSALDAYKYVAFEDQFRGSAHDIRERLVAYAADFEGASRVLDLGCGRGEFLDVLRERGVDSRGVDINPEMAALCRERGLQVEAGDALAYLLAQPDASLGGIFAAQVVEHLEPGYLMQLLEAAYRKLQPGSRIVLETVNPACWYAFFNSYLRDFTHVRALLPDTLRYLLVASGFQRIQIRYSAPVPEDWKLEPLAAHAAASPPVEGAPAGRAAELAAVFNENVRKLNDLFFTYQDYAAIGERPRV